MNDSAIKYDSPEAQDLAEFLVRKKQLMDARQNYKIEKIWKKADLDYVPHELGSPKKVLVENERTEVSTYVNLSKDKWRSKEASNDPYIKIQTAISILFDRNPEAVFDPANERFAATTELIEQLYHRTWTDTNIGAKQELRKFIFNLAKYGWAPARRYYRKEVRKGMQMIKKYDVLKDEFEYETKDITDLDDVYFESKSPWDVWIDDMARPDAPRSVRDWMWREVHDKMSFEAILEDLKYKGKVEDFKFSSVVEEETETEAAKEKDFQYTSDDLITVYFYENRQKDKMIVEANGKLVASMPLPRTDKELSLVQTYWVLRSDQCPYGIGLNEIMRANKNLKDKVRNMTIDQVVLSIYKTFFYSNAEQLDDEGGENISLEPGKGKKVIDPKNISWSDVPGPGEDSYRLLEVLDKDMEDDTGITKTLEGEITGKTAFEISQAQLGALKRLSNPLRSIKTALEWDAKLCINLMKMVYSIPKVYTFTDQELIKDYIASVGDDPERYFVEENGVFNALKYREFQLNLEMNEDGTFQGAEEKQFFMVMPKHMDWEGQIIIRVETMIEPSKPLEQQKKLDMSNILLPLIEKMSMNAALVPVFIKPVKQILKIYDEKPKDWLPAEWLMEMPMPGMAPMMGGMPGAVGGGLPPPPNAETVAPQSLTEPPTDLQGSIQSQSQSVTPV